MKPTHLDLFTGIGGFALAAKWAGFETIGFCEKEEYAQQVIIKNFGAIMADTDRKRHLHGKPEKQPTKRYVQALRESGTKPFAPRIFQDIRELDGRMFAGVDIISGGFPCQPYSYAGKRKGKEDDRSLWPQMFRVIKEAKPSWVIGENVAGFISMELDNCISDLEGIGYAVRPVVIPACAVDAKHRRDRVWIIANSQCVRSGASGTEYESPGKSKAFSSGHQESVSNALSAEQRRDERQSQVEGCTLADTTHDNRGGGKRGTEERIGAEEIRRRRFASSGQNVHHANGAQRQGNQRQIRGVAKHSDTGSTMRREIKPGFCGMVDGVSEGMDYCSWLQENIEETPRTTHETENRTPRLRGLGNAIVPQVAYQIMKRIRELLET